MLKTGIYIDAENVRLCGGYGMRYDVLADLANSGNCTLLRANSYVVEDRQRTEEDAEYRQKLYRYHDILRQYGFKLIKKYVKKFKDADGVITTKANADMDLAIDAILQARNLDRIILLTGDGDFVRLITALQNRGCRVEVIGFHNVSTELKEAADLYLSGFLIPHLLPISTTEDEKWHRGTVVNYNPGKGFGFMRYHQLTANGLTNDTVFFHRSKAKSDIDPQLFNKPTQIFEFKISAQNGDRQEATDIRTLPIDQAPRRDY
ncbi:MAG: NYN domain-containing protein [Desulfobulbaceae bacterium]|nr:NYN domain-containing protein [Desulfobulbaceae bacterium]